MFLSFLNTLGRKTAQASMKVRGAADFVGNLGDAAYRNAEQKRLNEWLKGKKLEIRKQIDPPEATDLERLEKALTGVASAVLQVSNRHARRIITAVAAKSGAAGAVVGIGGLIAMFGVAGTGAPIAILAGAASTTAKLYWIGSFIGLGVAAGGVMLAGASLGVGVGAAFLARKYVVGLERKEQDLQDYERAILVAAYALIAAVQQQIKTEIPVSKADMKVVAEEALIPMIHQIDMHWNRKSLLRAGEAVDDELRPLCETLSIWNQRKLLRHKDELTGIAIGALA